MGKQWFETASTSSGSRVVGRCGCAHFAYVDHSFYHEGPLDSNPFEWSQMGMVLLYASSNGIVQSISVGSTD